MVAASGETEEEEEEEEEGDKEEEEGDKEEEEEDEEEEEVIEARVEEAAVERDEFLQSGSPVRPVPHAFEKESVGVP